MKRTPIVLIVSILSLLTVGNGAYAGNKIMYKTNLFPKVTKPVTANLQYLGGPVISNVKIVGVFWGPNVDATTQAKIGGYFQALAASTYWNFLTEYDTNITAVNGRQGTNQTIGQGSFVANYTITPSWTSANIDDTNIQAELEGQIAAGKLPAADNNTVYMVMFPPGDTITLTEGGQTAASCEEFCAYHNSTVQGSTNLIYGVMPDLGGACATGCGNNDQFSNFTSACSHELTESITDPEVGDVPGNAVDYPMAWYDNSNGEIGDICVQTNGTITAANGTSYVVQGEWSNTQNACVTGPAASN